jgi:cell division septum initiation protein DivIVA
MNNYSHYSLKDNIKFLRQGLNAYTVESPEEDLEFLEAIENDINDLYDEVNDELKEKKEEITELEKQLSEATDEAELVNTIRTTDHIYWSAENMADQQVMESLTEVYVTLSLAQIIQRLKFRINGSDHQ